MLTVKKKIKLNLQIFFENEVEQCFAPLFFIKLSVNKLKKNVKKNYKKTLLSAFFKNLLEQYFAY